MPYTAAELIAAFPPLEPEWVAAKAGTAGPPPRWPPERVQEVRSALAFIRPDQRDVWLSVGMALHASGVGEQAFGLWDEWSRLTDSRNYDPEDQRRVWASFGKYEGRPIGLTKIFGLAKEGGWVNPKKRIRVMAEDSPSAEPPPSDDGAWRRSLVRNDKGKVTPCVANVRTVLRHDARWAGVLRYCAFSYRLLKVRPPPCESAEIGEWNDADTARLRIWLSDHFKFTPSVGDALDGALVVAQFRPYHPIRAYLEGITWDGIERLDHWLTDYVGAVGEGAYVRSVARKFLVGAVARVFDPGCKNDYVLIFEGLQGLGKSSAVEALFGEHFSDAPIRLNDKDAYQSIQGVWCQELAELDSLNRAESTEAKAFFSQRRDRYRPSYGRCTQDFLRQTVFVGTTNQSEYLKDDTGNRRYWPVRTMEIKLDALRAARDQLWAEALVAYRAGAQWWAGREEEKLFEAEQELRRQQDPWEYPVMRWLSALPVEFVHSSDVLRWALGKPLKDQTRADQNRLAAMMRKLSWQHISRWHPGQKKAVWCYQNPTVQDGRFYE